MTFPVTEHTVKTARHTTGYLACGANDAPLLVDITRDGVSFARAYDIRGRTISNVFTQPPVKPD